MKRQMKIAAVVSATALLAIGASFTSMAAAKTGTWKLEDDGWYCYDKDGDVYEIKIEGYSEPEVAPTENASTTVISPNITNLVRPVVKVVVNTPAPAPVEPEPEPEIETILEEPEVEADDEVEVFAMTEDLEELEVDAVLAAIPEVEEPEENTVDVIDVFWKERPHKTYRYDPNGNNVEDGDIVLVPTRDVQNDKEIVREAEVSRGNYKVDPETLDRPLKKIIGVVKHKAEQIFTAMIIPADENEDQN